MFYKVINHNLEEKKREVYLMSVFEDQIPKWENCLEPADDIQSFDRTFKLIKERLLKAVIERSKKLDSVHHDQSNAFIHIDEEAILDHWENELDYNSNEDEEVTPNTGYQKYRLSKRKAAKGKGLLDNQQLASSDEEEFSKYERKY